MDKEDLKYVNAGILGCSESGLTKESLLVEDFNSFKQSLEFPLEVYRGLLANSKESIDLKNVGKSWTTNPNLFLSSDTTLGNYIPASSCNYILTGYVDEDDVDLEQTETAFNNFSNDYWYSEDEFDYDCECEITLKDGATPKNIKIETREEFYGDYLGEQFKPKVKEDLSQEVDSEGNPLTKEQVEFFKNSKVRDKQGRLLVCYHGTDAEFNVFERGDIGFHFGTEAQARDIVANKSKKNIRKYYLNITSPLIIDKDLGVWDAYPIASFICSNNFYNGKFKKYLPKFLESLNGLDDVIDEITDFQYDDLNDADYTLENAIKCIIDYFDIDDQLDYDDLGNQLVRNVLVQEGYDGINYKNVFEDFGSGDRSYIAFEPNQIKSIDNKTPSNSESINEDLDSKTFAFPNLRQAIDFFWKDRNAKIETIPIKKLVDDNDLLNDEDLQSYHQRQWDNKKASEFSIDKSKAKMWRISEVPYAVRKKDGKLELGDGRHRTRALYNDGYEYVTLPVINETLDLSGKISTTINSSKKNDKLINRKRINENTSNIPTKKGKAYKVFKVKNGKLYPPMVANSGGKDTPIGVWLDAEEGEFAGLSKTGRPQVKRANKSGVLAYRPGWHLGDIPRAKQFDRLNKETGEYEFPKDFVWAECEYAMDIDYQPEADEQGYMRTKVDDNGNVTTYKSDKYQHSLAGLKKLPTKGYYKYRTNPDPNTVPWVITGQMKVNKLLDDFEVNEILKQNGIEPIHRQGGDKTLKELGLKEITVNESKTTPRIRESLLQEGKQDKENFRKWAEQAVEIAYKDKGLSDWERKGNAEYIVNWFENNRKNLKSPQNDYYYWIKEKNVQGAYDELNRLAVEQEKKKDSEKKSKDGARLIYSDNDWKVYEITTYEASVKYGANTKWCISGSKRWSNGENGRGYWDDYTSKGVKFYFFIGKGTKYAIAIYPNGTDFEIFDAQDNSIAYIPNAPIIDEIKVDYYSHNEDRLMLNLIKTGQLPHICPLLSQYLWESNYSTTIYDKNNFDNFLQEIRDNVNEDYVKWLAVYNGIEDEEWYEKETGEEYEDEWMGDTTYYLQDNLGFLDNYATLDDALTKDNPYFNYDNNEYFISDLYDYEIACCKDWVGVWLHIARYIKDETELVNFIKEEISVNWGYSDFEKVGLSKEYLQGETNLDESLEDFEDEVGKVYHGGIEKSLHKDFKSILWFTEDYDYALDFGENIFICNLNLKNTLIVGNTDGYIRGLIPTQFSTDFIRLANNLRVTPKELLKCNPDASKIYSIVRTKAFKDLCIKNGYDSVETEEFGHVCFGVFNLDQVDIVDTDFEDESTLETLSPMDESLKPNLRDIK